MKNDIIPARTSVCLLDRYEISPEDLAAYNRRMDELDRQRREARQLARGERRRHLMPNLLLVDGSR